ncbi:hypothetical protein OAI94_00315 [bacterium]|nr:hypothetical protein [bacterium]
MQKKQLPRNVTLILPVAGKSERFGKKIPKWLLATPNNNLMISESISKLDVSLVKEIILICIKDHIKKFISIENIKKSIQSNLKRKVKIRVCVLNKILSSQAHTISAGIKKMNINGPIFIKDCDNYFEYKIRKGNIVNVLNLNNANLVLAKNKSYIEIDKKRIVLRIIEKKVISDLFCTGGYGFESGKTFLETFNKIYKENNNIGEIYVSHVIQKMILENHKFEAEEVENYIDFGTYDEWKKYTDKFISIITEVDGIFFKKGSKYLNNKWSYEIIKNNMETLLEINKNKKLNFTIITNRPKSHKNKIERIFNSWGIKINNFISDQPLMTSITIRDFDPKNTYGKSISINIPSNSIEFSEYIRNLTN